MVFQNLSSYLFKSREDVLLSPKERQFLNKSTLTHALPNFASLYYDNLINIKYLVISKTIRKWQKQKCLEDEWEINGGFFLSFFHPLVPSHIF